jgi:hypothetical protein
MRRECNLGSSLHPLFEAFSQPCGGGSQTGGGYDAQNENGERGVQAFSDDCSKEDQKEKILRQPPLDEKVEKSKEKSEGARIGLRC